MRLVGKFYSYTPIKETTFMNGFVQTLDEGAQGTKLYRHSHLHFSFYKVLLDYDPQVSLGPHTRKDLDSISGNNILILNLIRRTLLEILTPTASKSQVCIFLTGGAGSGKSTFTRLVVEILGKNTVLFGRIADLNNQFFLISSG